MSMVNLNLPEELEQFVQGQTQTGRFGSPAEYIEALIKRAKNGKERLESLLIEGLDSGDAMPLDAAEWGRIRRDVEQRLSHG